MKHMTDQQRRQYAEAVRLARAGRYAEAAALLAALVAVCHNWPPDDRDTLQEVADTVQAMVQ